MSKCPREKTEKHMELLLILKKRWGNFQISTRKEELGVNYTGPRGTANNQSSLTHKLQQKAHFKCNPVTKQPSKPSPGYQEPPFQCQLLLRESPCLESLLF